MSTSAESIFHAARGRPLAEREEFLESACGSDASLRSQVEALLRADAEAGGFLMETTRQDRQSRLAAAGQRDLIGRAAEQVAGAIGEFQANLIPGYTIKRFVASGGMGSVYEAEQEYPKRRVALKVIRLDRVSHSARRRFEFETQVLATLQHSAVAQVFDAGFVVGDADRRPYFAMEFVDGRKLTDYCVLRNLSVRQRLELIATVCDGVEHAHQKGVIHRDLKPDNILVTADGQPKILDFGVGRAIESDVQLTTMETDIGKVIGTLPYMSPEQAAGDSKLLDTRSDVYSLGVIAYEVLTGRMPYDLRGLPLPQVLRTIQEAEPPRLSSTNRTLRGELETIVSCALAKDKEQRYGSASALAEDIRRYLRGEPISKRQLTAWYQFVKFASRNKPLVAGVTSTFLVLVVGLAVSLMLLNRAETQRMRAEHAEQQQALAAATAQRRADDLSMMTEFQATMLADIDPEQMGRQLQASLVDRLRVSLEAAGTPSDEVESTVGAFKNTLRGVNATDTAVALIDEQWLSRAADSVERKFQDQPRVLAALQQTLANAYRELGRFDQAQPLQDSALALRRAEFRDTAPETLLSINQAGLLLSARGQLTAAEAHYREALNGLRDLMGEENEDTLMVLSNLSAALYKSGQADEAERSQRMILAGRRRVLGDDHPDTLDSLNSVGFLLEKRGALDEAEPYYAEALAGRRRIFGEDHPDTLVSINNLGSLREQQGRFGEAEQYYREALAGRQRIFGNDHPDTLSALNNVGHVLLSQGKLAEALPFYQAASEGRRRVLGDEHPDTLSAVSNLASLLQEQGHLEEAEPLLRTVLDGRRRALGDEHPDTLTAMANLGVLLDLQGRLDEAEPLYRDALDGLRAVQAEDHPTTLVARSNLATLLLHQNKLDEAEPLLRSVLDQRRSTLGEDHPDTLSSLTNLAAVYQKQGRLDAAEPLCREVVAGRRRRLGDDHPDTLNALANLGVVLHGLHRLDEAQEVWREALEGRRRKLGDDHPDTLSSVANMGVLYEARGKLAEAEKYYQEALEGRRRVLGDDHPDTVNSMSDMGSLRLAQDGLVGAEAYYREALAGNRHVWGDDHPETLVAINNLGLVLREQGKLAESEGYYRQALDGLRRVAGDDHPLTLAARVNTGQLQQQQGKFAEAEQFIREALEGLRRVRGDEHPNTLNTINILGQLLMAQGKLAEAEPYLLEALDGDRRAHGEDHADTCADLNNMGRLRRKQGRLADAESYHRAALECRRQAFGNEHTDTLASINNLALVLIEDGRPAEALALLTEGEPAARRLWSQTRAGSLGTYLVKLGTARSRLRDFASAEDTLLEAYHLIRNAPDQNRDWTAGALEALVDLYDTWHVAEPDQEYDAKAAQYRELLQEQRDEP